MAIEAKTPFVIEQLQGASPAYLLDSRYCPGTVFWVDSVNGTNAVGRGRTPSQPLASVAYCFSQSLVTADKGDLILAAPLHVETLTAAASVAWNIAGVTLQGLGTGRQRARFNYTTAAAASLDITAARATIRNCTFTPIGVDAVTAAINVTAADFTMEDCEMELGDATNQATLGILTNASANRMCIRRCHFHGSTDAGTTSAIRIVGGDSIVIEDCIIVGAFAVASGCIEQITTATTMLIIRRNSLLNRTADNNNLVIALASGSTGLIVHNYGGIIDSTAPAPVTAAGMHVGANWWSTAAGVTASVLM